MRLSRLRFQRSGDVGGWSDGEHCEREDLEPEHADRLGSAKRRRHVGNQHLGADQQLAKRQPLNHSPRQDLRGLHDPLRQLLGIVGDVVAAGLDTEVEQPRDPLRVRDPIGELTLHRQLLEVGGHFAERKGHVAAGQRDRDDRRRRPEVPEAQTRSLAAQLTILIMQDVCRRRILGVGEHVRAPC
jgi:hypothetical protein